MVYSVGRRLVYILQDFETFPNSMILLFQMCTSAGWSVVFQSLRNDRPPDCDPTISLLSHKDDCGNTAIAIPFLVSYVRIEKNYFEVF